MDMKTCQFFAAALSINKVFHDTLTKIALTNHLQNNGMLFSRHFITFVADTSFVHLQNSIGCTFPAPYLLPQE